jgi:hypothetical protein
MPVGRDQAFEQFYDQDIHPNFCERCKPGCVRSLLLPRRHYLDFYLAMREVIVSSFLVREIRVHEVVMVNVQGYQGPSEPDDIKALV